MKGKAIEALLAKFPLKELSVLRPADLYSYTQDLARALAAAEATPRLEELTELLKAESSLGEFDGGLLNSAAGGMQVRHSHLANWLVWRAATTTPGLAVADLQRGLDRREVDVWDVVIIESLETQQSVEIADGVRLLPLHEVPDSVWKIEMERQASRMPLVRDFGPPPRSALIRPAMIAPRFVDPSKDDRYVLHKLDPESAMFDIARCLTLMPNAAPITSIFYSQLCDHEPCAHFAGSAFGYQLEDVTHGPNYRIDENGISLLREDFGHFRRLPSEDKPFFRLVLERLNQAKRRRSLADRALDLGIAFEALLLRDQQPPAQLGMTVRYRAAWLLGGESVEERKKVFGNVGKVYGHRSAAAHGGEISSKSERKRRIAQKEIKEGIALCVAAIRALLERGYPSDWDEVVLGGGV